MTNPAKSETPEADAPRRCPICGKPAEVRWRPFCSKRCADIDLNRWLSGAYAVPVVEDDETPPEGGAEG
jgi:endogenous inhibitor of DNA gyrase (YacG/DUF329 family)